MPWPAILAAEFAMLTVAVALSRGYRRYAPLIVVLVVAALAMPFLLPHNIYLRALANFPAIFVGIKLTQARQMPREWGFAMRMWHAFMPADILRARRVPPQIDTRLLLQVLCYGSVGAACVYALFRFPYPALSVPTFLIAAVIAYTAAEAVFDAPRLVHRMIGWETPPLQHTPIAARSVAEFWSERWNSLMSEWLAERTYIPLARRRMPVLGVVAAFALSSAVHFFLFAAPFGWRLAGIIALFFMVQPLFIFAERALRQRKWPLALRRIWTIGLVLLSSPLFTWPILNAAGMR